MLENLKKSFFCCFFACSYPTDAPISGSCFVSSEGLNASITWSESNGLRHVECMTTQWSEHELPSDSHGGSDQSLDAPYPYCDVSIGSWTLELSVIDDVLWCDSGYHLNQLGDCI